MSVSELSYASHVTTATIYNLENGRQPSLGVAQKLAQALGVSLADLFDEDGAA